MKYPTYLRSGGTIGLVAPSFGCSVDPYKSCLEAAEKRFEGMGYKIVEGPNCRKNEGIGISSTPENCGKELTEYYCSGDNDMLITCGGGELMCESLDYVDFEAVKSAKPKWYMGYSDNTNFTFLLNTICDVASIYGPSIGAFGMEKLEPALMDAIDIFTGKKQEVSGFDKFELESLKDEEHPFVGYNLTEKKELRLFMGEAEVNRVPEFSGIITGGCLDCLANLVGTKYDKVAEFNERYKDQGVVWFLEACDLNVMSIRRALWNLDRAGWFKNAKGFIIGRPLCAWKQEMMGLDQYNAVTGILGKYNVPIVMDADVGHLAPAMPIVSGSLTTVSVGENITIKYK
ncbi:S66 family peptidase [Pseudobutyrivibrio xylanivorans]|uniref:Muramoyltetrapeptide carboxypeptidase LdcA (Peptidoglycan recycling) n=1 Tax=Pseudobutyrivibrio xylanivorans TaxID=185007 RepID=A0A1G5S1Q4_PSEXY|nr:S66 peptidase family protein [Pseudobutyrivibrio xylanivorans]SCZ80294.1 Muramoyltetrapeptide carboxypeptidase LdcA (peptidoglycan recycling) [Pseudobutyrivibrio xylanivorans]